MNQRRPPLPGDIDFNPVDHVPIEFQPAIAMFIGMHMGKLKDQITSLCLSIKYWHEREGLTIEELKPILAEMSKSENVAEIRSRDDFMNKIAAGVAAANRRRKVEQDMIERRRAASGSAEQLSLIDQFKKRIASKGVDD